MDLLPAQDFLIKVNDDFLLEKKVQLYVLPLYLTDRYVSGNKWYKLKYNLQEAYIQKKETLLTFGGAYSNHLIAVAAAAYKNNFKSVAIVRGEKTLPLNKVLAFCEKMGMQLHYVSREEYRQKESVYFIEKLKEKFHDFYLIPEGGSNTLAVKGCLEIAPLITIDFDYICCASGTGATIAGIIASLNKNQTAIGFPVLKEGHFLKEKINRFLEPYETKAKWELQTGYHFGGYAKKNNTLDQFISSFQNKTNIPLDFVYTGKLLFGIYDLIGQEYFPSGSTIVAVHTGGVVNF